MDAGTIAAIGLGITTGTSLVLVTVYAVNTKGVANNALHKAKNVEQAHTGFVRHADTVYARKETIGPQLVAMTAALERIERNQEALTKRFMDGAMGQS